MLNEQKKVEKAKPNIGRLKRLLLPILLFFLISLTGCVRYDVGVNFYEQHHVTFVLGVAGFVSSSVALL